MIKQEHRDSEHLKILAVFHYVMGGLAFLGILFLCFHYFVFSTVMNSDAITNDPNGGAPPKEFLSMMVWFYLLMGLILLAGMIANLLSARFMRSRKNRVFSIIVAGINCLQIPVGTALGVFTIIVLLRESVIRTYEKSA